MKDTWSTSVFPIAVIFSFRMLGLFMLIPVFTVLATKLDGATPTLMGIALGSYGLSQALLQMPFGMLSDRYGRKKIITLGLILFALGSLLGALTHSIYGMIIARILQGMGAIGSVLIALLADLTREEQRTQAMAVVGMTIGISFSLAMVLSPAITYYFDLAGIFYLTALLALTGLLLLHAVIRSPKKECFHFDSEAKLTLLKTVLLNSELQRLNAGIFFQHVILTATFFVIPILLQERHHLNQSWHFYLPLMLISFVLMIPFIILAERKYYMKSVFLIAVCITGLSQFWLALAAQYWLFFYLLMIIYFIAFNILEATLPALISKQAAPHNKGTAMGVYSSCQYIGIFAGGILAGVLFQYSGISSVFIANAVMSLIWLLIALPMKPAMGFSTLLLPYVANNEPDQQVINKLLITPGISSAIIAQEEHVVYLRINKTLYQTGSAESILHDCKKNNQGEN